MPSIYQLTTVKEVVSKNGRQRWSFEIIGVIGKGLVHFSYDNRIDAEKARLEMQDGIMSAVTIEPLFVR
jgi:hypothetical protein